jgi:hypothetical protein
LSKIILIIILITAYLWIVISLLIFGTGINGLNYNYIGGHNNLKLFWFHEVIVIILSIFWPILFILIPIWVIYDQNNSK